MTSGGNSFNDFPQNQLIKCYTFFSLGLHIFRLGFHILVGLHAKLDPASTPYDKRSTTKFCRVIKLEEWNILQLGRR